MDVTTINSYISANRLDEALALISRALNENPQDAEALFARGRINWRKGLRGEAISDYEAAVAIDPASPARIALDQARDVMDFFNPDIFNP
ncbi:MAG: tetratricopeptide repeat protein [Muribaculaceae bacterium]|nr:tetratricopeptide repeat protein [Muribaculaceae bacterium]MDE6322190.1 tetratricopeptide repeat protein [Muribaculaceae bacterium]